MVDLVVVANYGTHLLYSSRRAHLGLGQLLVRRGLVHLACLALRQLPEIPLGEGIRKYWNLLVLLILVRPIEGSKGSFQIDSKMNLDGGGGLVLCLTLACKNFHEGILWLNCKAILIINECKDVLSKWFFPVLYCDCMTSIWYILLMLFPKFFLCIKMPLSGNEAPFYYFGSYWV